MPKATLSKAIRIYTKNDVGVAAELSSVVSGCGINIRAVSGWTDGDKGFVQLLTEDNTKTLEVLKSRNFHAEEEEVIVMNLPNQSGQLKNITGKIQRAKINISYIYGTTSTQENGSLLVLSTADNKRVVEEMNK